VLVFATALDAEQHGYMACRRCHPQSLAPAEKSIASALDYINAHLDQSITLSTLSQISGLSPNHLQRTFKRIVGISPKEFCDAQRVLGLKRRLRLGESVTAAIYGVGYGSCRALYEKAHGTLGMTPATYRRGAPGVTIRYAIVSSSLGQLLIARTDDGVCSVNLHRSEVVLLDDLHAEFPNAVVVEDAAKLDQLKAVVRACEQADPLLSKMPLELRRKLLRVRVLHGVRTHGLRTRLAEGRDQNLAARTG
jgi:AraC family transcriptional regulator of adaptative response/methylated-DNA-[protein]-cysteine methyltransferase